MKTFEREWQEDEADELQRLVARGLSWDLIGMLLKRGRIDVHTQAAIMGLRRPGNRPYTASDERGGPWTDADLARLRALVSAGHSWRSVAELLGRTRYAVKLRAARLGLLVDGRRAANDLTRAELSGWPELQGTPQQRDLRFRQAVVAEAVASGLLRRAAA